MQSHYNTTIKPYKECTRIFTRVTGLPCAHVYNKKKNTSGFVLLDFHKHWFWDWSDLWVPYLDPITTQTRSNLPTTHNTEQILSAFEQVKQSESQRYQALSKCSSCGGIGHIMRSQNCPNKLCASIARDSQILREQELLQASSLPITPRPAKRV